MNIDLHDERLQSTTFKELSLGQGATLRRVLTDADSADFAAMSGDLNPPDLDQAHAQGEGLPGRTAGGPMGSGVVLGARVPIALTSRADGATSRLASAALAVLVAHSPWN